MTMTDPCPNPSLSPAGGQSIAPAEVARRLAGGGAVRLVDVRTPLEYAEVHAAGALPVPLDEFAPDRLGDAPTTDNPVYLLCKSGGRATKAQAKLAEAGWDHCVVVAGGTDAWVAAGLPVERAAGVISMERQVRIAAGAMVLIGAILGWLVHPGFFGLSAFVGAGLVFAGITNFCGMGLLIARMPWNRNLACTSCKG